MVPGGAKVPNARTGCPGIEMKIWLSREGIKKLKLRFTIKSNFQLFTPLFSDILIFILKFCPGMYFIWMELWHPLYGSKFLHANLFGPN